VPEASNPKPTAMHAEAPGQATPISRPPLPPGTFEVAWRLQLLPSQRSATVENAPELSREAPTAVHADEDEHETLFRKANCDPDGSGVDFTVHFVPFHCSASVTPAAPELSVVPTAVQAEDDAHDTEARLGDGPGLGVDWMLHAVPFHRSASVPRLEAPTAVHAVEDVQDTPEKPLPCAPAGFGVDCTAQEVPFQRSASVTPVPELSVKFPTAVQLEADEHDTAFKNVFCDPGGSGIDWMLHAVPFHRSANAWNVLELSMKAPTAMHAEDEVHDRPRRLLTAAPGGFGIGS
jgi:hypothetical protein